MAADALVFVDDDGTTLTLDAEEAVALWGIAQELEPATVSACPTCRSRVLAAVALVDLLEESAPHPRALELLELAEEAPTLHVFLHDVLVACRHRSWRDPGYAEWREAFSAVLDEPRRPR